jgi:hypothetical protein
VVADAAFDARIPIRGRSSAAGKCESAMRGKHVAGCLSVDEAPALRVLAQRDAIMAARRTHLATAARVSRLGFGSMADGRS